MYAEGLHTNCGEGSCTEKTISQSENQQLNHILFCKFIFKQASKDIYLCMVTSSSALKSLSL